MLSCLIDVLFIVEVLPFVFFFLFFFPPVLLYFLVLCLGSKFQFSAWSQELRKPAAKTGLMRKVLGSSGRSCGFESPLRWLITLPAGAEWSDFRISAIRTKLQQ